MEIKFFFWNVNDLDESIVGSVLSEIKSEVNPDIIALAETNISDSFISSTFNARLIHHISRKSKRTGREKHLKLYSNNKGFTLTKLSDFGNGEILSSVLNVNGKLIIVSAVHFLSRMSKNTEDSRFENAIDYRNYLEGLEIHPNVKTTSSIIFGDFNANPFERAFTSSRSLFAIDLIKPPTRRLAKYKYYINPTISQIGHFSYFSDGRTKPPGSYFYAKKDIAEQNEWFWNAIDGMFFRPDLISNYRSGSDLEVVKGTKNYTLFDDANLSMSNKYSDHLPIKFSFNF